MLSFTMLQFLSKSRWNGNTKRELEFENMFEQKIRMFVEFTIGFRLVKLSFFSTEPEILKLTVPKNMNSEFMF